MQSFVTIGFRADTDAILFFNLTSLTFHFIYLFDNLMTTKDFFPSYRPKKIQRAKNRDTNYKISKQIFLPLCSLFSLQAQRLLAFRWSYRF